MGRHDRDCKRRHRTATAVSLRRLALQRRCQACGRKGALARLELDAWTAALICRRCGFERPRVAEGAGAAK